MVTARSNGTSIRDFHHLTESLRLNLFDRQCPFLVSIVILQPHFFLFESTDGAVYTWDCRAISDLKHQPVSGAHIYVDTIWDISMANECCSDYTLAGADDPLITFADQHKTYSKDFHKSWDRPNNFWTLSVDDVNISSVGGTLDPKSRLERLAIVLLDKPEIRLPWRKLERCSTQLTTAFETTVFRPFSVFLPIVVHEW